MRAQIWIANFTLFVLSTAMNVWSQYQQLPVQGQSGKWAIGVVKQFSNGSIALEHARDFRDPGSQPADMTFIITANTVWLHRELIREGGSAAVHYLEQNGKLVAVSIATYGAPAPYGRSGGYGAAVPTPPQPSPSYPGVLPAASNAKTNSTQPKSGACLYTAGPCLSTPGPQLLPASTGHDFNSVRDQADGIARQYQEPRIYKIHLNYVNGSVWQAEFDYVTLPSGKHRNSRWGDCRVSIDPSTGNARQYQSVVEFNDQIDDPPPLAPPHVASPWEPLSSMNIPASIRQSPGGISVDLHQLGATHRVVRPTYQNEKYLNLLAHTVGSGTWVWASSWPYPSNTGTVYQILYVEATGGRGMSECANMTDMNENSWSVITCPAINESSNHRRPNRFPK